MVTDSAAQQELLPLLERWAQGFADRCRNAPAHGADHDRSPDLQLGRRGLGADEARAFLRALRHELVSVDEDGRFELPGVGECSSNLHLIGRDGPAVTLHTEYLIQVGAYAELVLDHGWPRRQLRFEQGPMDIEGDDTTGRCVLAVEAKARIKGPNGLDELRQHLQRAAAGADTTQLPRTPRRKWERLADLSRAGAGSLWLVADGARWLYVARARDDGVDLEPRLASPTFAELSG